jgi:hypothetical protein
VVGPDFVHLSRTHDISETEYHVSTIEDVGASLESAIQAVWSDRDKIRYSRVLVLLLSWEEDDLGVESELNRLQEVFVGIYHFTVERFRIPSLKSAIEVHRRVMEFVGKDEVETLRILYYGGHARRLEQSTGPPTVRTLRLLNFFLSFFKKLKYSFP